MLVYDAEFALRIPLKDVGGADEIEFFCHALAAADIPAGGLELKSVARDARVRANEHDIDRAKLQLHTRVRLEILSRTAHGA